METEHYPRQMNLDGCECPVVRGGIAQTLCFTDLTGEEQQQYLNTLSKEDISELCITFAGALRGICEVFHIPQFDG